MDLSVLLKLRKINLNNGVCINLSSVGLFIKSYLSFSYFHLVCSIHVNLHLPEDVSVTLTAMPRISNCLLFLQKKKRKENLLTPKI